MPKVVLAAELDHDFERILGHLVEHGVADAASRIGEIVEAIAVLEHHPLIGRPAAKGHRELVIGRRSHGYVALYRHVEAIDTIFVLAIRGQKEAGYPNR